mgnify:CR=1 FL=1
MTLQFSVKCFHHLHWFFYPGSTLSQPYIVNFLIRSNHLSNMYSLGFSFLFFSIFIVINFTIAYFNTDFYRSPHCYQHFIVVIVHMSLSSSSTHRRCSRLLSHIIVTISIIITNITRSSLSLSSSSPTSPDHRYHNHHCYHPHQHHPIIIIIIVTSSSSSSSLHP